MGLKRGIFLGCLSWSQPFSISSDSGRLVIKDSVVCSTGVVTWHKLDQSDSLGNSARTMKQVHLMSHPVYVIIPANVIPRATVTLVSHSPCYSSVFGSLEELQHSPDNSLSFSLDFLNQNPGFTTYIMSDLTKSLTISVP